MLFLIMGITIVIMIIIYIIVFALSDSKDKNVNQNSNNTMNNTDNNLYSLKTPAGNIEELYYYKELLDITAITQEEFDAKKKELLGL